MSIEERVALLQKVRFFSTTSPSALPAVAAIMDPLQLAAGEILFHKSDIGQCLYVIVSGRLRVYDGELLLNHLGEGDVVGEMAALDAETRSASVSAEVDTLLLGLEQHALFELLKVHSEVAYGIIQVLCRHLRARVRDVSNDFAYISVVEKIAAAARAMEQGEYRSEQLDDISRRADALGDLSRTFQHMADEVQARERYLRAQVQEMRIEIDKARQEQRVTAITRSDYFRSLQEQADALRASLDEEEL
jgi:CRP/FNR family cyclic AMP-dependent transcriptional regulator